VSIVRRRVATATEGVAKTAPPRHAIVGSVGIGVRNSDELKWIGASPAKLKADGRLEKIPAKWGLA
jgi:hypothetical protein